MLRIVHALGFLIAVLAVGLCVRLLIREWSSVQAALSTANIGLLVAALLLGGLGMWLLAVLWWRCLAVFGERRGVGEVGSWYFAGELGKYLPGSIWTIVGRGELARRAGVSRAVAYATTLFSLATMCVGGAIACGLLAPFFVFDGGRIGPELLLVLLAPIGLLVVHPTVFGRVLQLGRWISRGRIDLTAPRWGSMVTLIGLAVLPWIAIGTMSVLICQALSLDQHPARIAFAAVVAWVIGFLAVPVPAGAGVRELLFVLASGLASGPATAVAAIARIGLMVVDAVGGLIGLAVLGPARRRREAASSPDTTSTAGTDVGGDRDAEAEVRPGRTGHDDSGGMAR